MTSSTEVANEAKERAADVRDTALQQAADVRGTVKDQTGQVVQEATAQARNLLDEARAQVREQAGLQQSRIRSLLDDFADELETMASAGGRDGIATDVVRQVAARTRSLTSGIGSADGGEILESLRSYARRHPGTFLLAAGFAGVLAGRATRSAKEVRSSTSTPNSSRAPALQGAAPAGSVSGEPSLGEPSVTQSFSAPGAGAVDLTDAEAIPASQQVRPGDENEWAPVPASSATQHGSGKR